MFFGCQRSRRTSFALDAAEERRGGHGGSKILKRSKGCWSIFRSVNQLWALCEENPTTKKFERLLGSRTRIRIEHRNPLGLRWKTSKIHFVRLKMLGQSDKGKMLTLTIITTTTIIEPWFSKGVSLVFPAYCAWDSYIMNTEYMNYNALFLPFRETPI